MLKKLKEEKINWSESTAFFLVHLTCILVIWAGFSWVALIAFLITWGVRMFGITAGYHRYFAHRTYKTSRFFQFSLAFLGSSAAQKGPLWWAANHRHHHLYSDTENDVHSPTQQGFWWSQVGWILCNKYKDTKLNLVKDLAKFPELRFLNRHHLIAPVILAVFMTGLGMMLNYYFPALNTSGFQMLIWGFFISTTFLYHSTFTVNSLTHVFGRQRFDTGDDSKNNLFIALLTMGEGWHNNHHRFPASERQGFYWWEIDMSHYTLRILSWFKIVSELRGPPARVYAETKFLKKPSKTIAQLLWEEPLTDQV